MTEPKRRQYCQWFDKNGIDVFVDSVPSMAEPDHLMSILSPFGEIQRISINPPRYSNYSATSELCLATVNFKQLGSAENAIRSCNGQRLFEGWTLNSGLPAPANNLELANPQIKSSLIKPYRPPPNKTCQDRIGRNFLDAVDEEAEKTKRGEVNVNSDLLQKDDHLEPDEDKNLIVKTISVNSSFVDALNRKQRFIRMFRQNTGCEILCKHDWIDIKGKPERISKAEELINAHIAIFFRKITQFFAFLVFRIFSF